MFEISKKCTNCSITACLFADSFRHFCVAFFKNNTRCLARCSSNISAIPVVAKMPSQAPSVSVFFSTVPDELCRESSPSFSPSLFRLASSMIWRSAFVIRDLSFQRFTGAQFFSSSKYIEGLLFLVSPSIRRSWIDLRAVHLVSLRSSRGVIRITPRLFALGRSRPFMILQLFLRSFKPITDASLC